MNKKAFAALAAAVLLMVGICAYHGVTAIKLGRLNQERIAMASYNARVYIKNKYGFEPEIKKVSDDWHNSFLPDKYGRMLLDAGFENKEFKIVADCLAENTYGVDSYQYDDVREALEREILSEADGGMTLEISILTDIQGKDGDTVLGVNGFEKYFDGSNFDEVLPGCRGNVSMIFADKELSDSHAVSMLRGTGIQTELISFDTEDRMKEFYKQYSEQGYRSIDYSLFMEYAPYITGFTGVKKGEISGLDIRFQSGGDFIYSYFPVENYDFPVSADMTVQKREADSLVQSFARYDEGEYVSRPLTDAYFFDCRYGDIYVYYPLDKLPDIPVENIGAAWYSGGGIVNNRNIAELKVRGDYAVFRLPYHQMEFVLVDTSGYEEYVPGWAKDK